jgi:hypothetical protein
VSERMPRRSLLLFDDLAEEVLAIQASIRDSLADSDKNIFVMHIGSSMLTPNK